MLCSPDAATASARLTDRPGRFARWGLGAASTAALLSGCAILPPQPDFNAGLIMPAPAQSSVGATGPTGADAQTDAAATRGYNNDPASCQGAQAADSEVGRNACVTDLITEINAAYYQYEIKINQRISGVNSAADVGGVVLSAVGTALTDKTTRTALSAVGSVVKGAQADFNKDVLYQDTMAMLVHQMQADRAKILAGIRLSLRKPIGEYTLAQAKSDLNDFLHAGTLVDALSNLTQSTSNVASKCEAAEAAVKSGGGAVSAAAAAKPNAPAATTTSDQCNAILAFEGVYHYSSVGKQIEKLWTPDQGLTYDDTNESILKSCLVILKLKPSITSLINGDNDQDGYEVLGCYAAKSAAASK